MAKNDKKANPITTKASSSASSHSSNKGNKCKNAAMFLTILVAVLAIVYHRIWNSVWGIGYDLQSCAGCQLKVDWSHEQSKTISMDTIQQFQKDGVVVVPQMLEPEKVQQVARHVDQLPTTFMTDVMTRVMLKHYLKYEHRLNTRSELIRDWAYGPLASWAAQLLNATHLRLYNAEAIYHKGPDSPTACRPSWHRDTIAAPFAPHIPSLTINVYFDDISGGSNNESNNNPQEHGDALIYLKGSHFNLTHPPSLPKDSAISDQNNNELLFEPKLQVGDILAHNPHVFHTPSGKKCWKRRSLQFRYVAAFDDHGKPTQFHFDTNRWPHGPIPWSLAQAGELFPHGLREGDILQGPGYPQVYPRILPQEQVPFDTTQGNLWSLSKILQMAQQSEAVSKSKPHGFTFLDGLVQDASDWDEIALPDTGGKMTMLMHRQGPQYQYLLQEQQQEEQQGKQWQQ